MSTAVVSCSLAKGRVFDKAEQWSLECHLGLKISTHLKFNIEFAPEKLSGPKRKGLLITIHFQGRAVELQGCTESFTSVSIQTGIDLDQDRSHHHAVSSRLLTTDPGHHSFGYSTTTHETLIR